MGLFSFIGRVANVAEAIVMDTVTLGGMVTGRDEPYTEIAVEKALDEYENELYDDE